MLQGICRDVPIRNKTEFKTSLEKKRRRKKGIGTCIVIQFQFDSHEQIGPNKPPRHLDIFVESITTEEYILTMKEKRKMGKVLVLHSPL